LCLVNEVYVLQIFLCRYRVAEIAWVQDNPPEGLEQRTEVFLFFWHIICIFILSLFVCASVHVYYFLLFMVAM
jgi:hypothetical protein